MKKKNRTQQPWWFLDYGYQTKAALVKEIRKIVRSYSNGTVLRKDDDWLMRQIFKRHREYAVKEGAGIKSIEVRTNEAQSDTRGFWINRIDGTSVDISWPKCLNPEGEYTLETEVHAAARCDVEHLIEKYWEKPRTRVCILCGKPCLYWRAKTHVASISPSFKELMNSFLKEMGLTYDDIIVESSDFRSSISDRRIREEWKAFYAENAVLDLVHATCNRKRKRK